MSTIYAARPHPRHQIRDGEHITARDLQKGQAVIENDVADFLLSGLTTTTDLPKELARSISTFMWLSQNIHVQQSVYLKFLRSVLNTYGPQSAVRTCAVPMQFMDAWAEYLLAPECPDTKSSDDQSKALLTLWCHGSAPIKAGTILGSLQTTLDRLTTSIGRLEKSRSQPQQASVSAAACFWGNVEDHWTNTRAR